MADLTKVIGMVGEGFAAIAEEFKETQPKHIVQKVFAGTKLYRITTDNTVVPFLPVGVAVEKDGRECKISFINAPSNILGTAAPTENVPAENVFFTPMEAYVQLLARLEVLDIVPNHLRHKHWEEAK